MCDPKKTKMLKDARKRSAKKSYGVQYNVKAGGEMYAPSRDFARNYPKMIDMVINCFSRNYWPELFDIYNASVKTSYDWNANRAFDELEKAKDVYCEFINQSYKKPEECCDDVLRRVGWLEVKIEVQVIWLAMLGQVITGQLFAGVRDLYLRPEGAEPADIDVLLESGHDARRAMNGIDKATETKEVMSAKLRASIRMARLKGASFDDISELVADVRLGRVPADTDAKFLP